MTSVVGPLSSHRSRATLAGKLDRAQMRLLDELDDDGIALDDDDELLVMIIEELDRVRRPPVHEGRRSMYGAFVLDHDDDVTAATDLVEVIDLPGTLEESRRFADGRFTFIVRRPDGRNQLACFRRSVQYEADLVEVQRQTGGRIAQRTPFDTVRLLTDDGVVEWTGRRWTVREHADHLLATIDPLVAGASREVLSGVLDLCVHWLSTAKIGATLVYDFDPVEDDAHALDLDAAIDVPSLSVLVPHHFPALFSSLGQTDLAAIVDRDGNVRLIGVGLRSSIESERAVPQKGGMRHRSAARFTWDHHHTIAFVVSEDGPVTVFRQGRRIKICDVT